MPRIFGIAARWVRPAVFITKARRSWICGGIRNRETGEPWEEETMALVYSTTKGRRKGVAFSGETQDGTSVAVKEVVKGNHRVYWSSFSTGIDLPGQAESEEIIS